MAKEYKDIILKNKLFFDNIASFYADIYPLRERSLKVLSQHLSSSSIKKDNSRILDLGCGIGTLLWSLKKTCPDSECFGLDISKKMINTAEKILKGKKTYFKCGDWFNSNNYPRKDFDLILCCGNSISHYPRTTHEHLFKTVYNHLAKGGRFICDTYKNWKPYLKKTEIRPRGLIFSGKRNIYATYFLDIPYKNDYLERRIFLFEYRLKGNVSETAQKTISQTIYHYPVSIREIKELLVRTGFKKSNNFVIDKSNQLSYIVAEK